jgi:acetyl-CoA acetyltransferase
MAASSGKAAASFAASSVSVGAKGIFIVVGVHTSTNTPHYDGMA